jgi:spore germination protein GerM
MVNAPNNTDTQTVEVLRKTQMALISDPEAAKRLARTIISDITIYNKEKVKEGLRNDNLFDVLKIDLEKGRKVYESKVSPEIVQTTNFYDLAIVDIMVQQATDMYSKI